MTFPKSRPIKPLAGRLSKSLRWLFAGIGSLCLVLLLGWETLVIYFSNLPWGWARLVLVVAFLTLGIWALWYLRKPRAIGVFAALFLGVLFWCLVLLLGWATLAIYYSNLPWGWLRLVLALAFLTFGIWALWYSRKPRAIGVLAALFLGLLFWWSTISPSHDRPWRPEVAVMPRAFIDGDRVRITGFRNFDYRTRDDFTVRYEEREVSLAHLNSLDFYVSYFWSDAPVAHTFVSFGFDNALPVSISIETRPEIGEGFAPLPSIFKQFELIYVVGDERDLVRVRTNYRNEEVYLYRIRTSPENARRLFLIYLDRVNELADHPEWYHLFSNSCTVNIVRYANLAGRVGRLDIRHILNGFSDRYLYRAGALDTTLPFAELRRRSRINEAAQAAGNAKDFSERIRKSLPTPPL
jgi:Domain of unknown function (DUF4105)